MQRCTETVETLHREKEAKLFDETDASAAADCTDATVRARAGAHHESSGIMCEAGEVHVKCFVKSVPRDARL